MISMFKDAVAFSNHDLSSWNVTNVTRFSNFLTNAGPGNTPPLF